MYSSGLRGGVGNVLGAKVRAGSNPVISTITLFTPVVKLVDTLDLGSSALVREGSNPSRGTKKFNLSSGIISIMR